MVQSLDPAIVRLARATDGVVTTAQLSALGLTKSAISHRQRCGSLVRVHCRVYVVPAEITDRTRTLARAGLIAAPAGAIASHVLAGYLHALPDLPALVRAEVQIPLSAGKHAIARIAVHRVKTAACPVHIGGLPVTPLVRTLQDLAVTCSAEQLLSAIDNGLHRGLLTPVDLQQLADPDHRYRGALLLRRMVPLADGRSESALESRTRLLLVDAGLLAPDLQIEVRLGHLVFRIDLGYPGLFIAIEVDGRAFHQSPEAVLNDRLRQNALVNAGWLVLRFTWDDVLNRPWYVVATVRRPWRHGWRVGQCDR